MRLAKVTVNGLFGIFDHPIPIRLEERITIMHGPNGYGKTIILRLIAAFFDGKYSILRAVPFATFLLDFDNGHSVRVEQHPPTLNEKQRKDRRDRKTSTLKILELRNGSEVHSFSPMDPRERFAQSPLSVERIEHFLPFLSRIGVEAWRDERTGERMSLDEVIERFGDELPIPEQHEKREPDWLQELRKSFSVRLIRTQRLDIVEQPSARVHRTTASHAVPTVQKYSEELAANIKNTLTVYAAGSQELDRTFPTRLLHQDMKAALTADAITEKLADLEKERIKLTALGFLDQEQSFTPAPGAVVDHQRGVLSVYVDDVAKKLSVFDEMASKIEVFTSIINQHFMFKSLKINREKGLVFTSQTGVELSPGELSSGEQHEIVLLYDLLFKLRPNALVLIDEPEISLHIAWQERFLADLKRIIMISSLDALIATHSPEIIGENWNLTVELKAPSASAKL